MNKLIEAKNFAIKKHGNQLYGTFPYEVHLINVVNVLLRNNIFPDSEENIDIWAGAWLHDVLEDTSTTKDEMVEKFGNNVYEIVWALTDGEQGDRNEKKKEMYKKLIHNQDAIIVKLADRITNLEYSIIGNNQKKVDKYILENIELNNQLANIITSQDGKILLNNLNELVAKFSNLA